MCYFGCDDISYQGEDDDVGLGGEGLGGEGLGGEGLGGEGGDLTTAVKCRRTVMLTAVMTTGW